LTVQDVQLDTIVLSRVAARLGARASDFIHGDAIDTEFADQVRSILGEARQLIRAEGTPHTAVSVEYGDTAELTAQGELRAQENQHPAEALMAAEVLFDESIPPFLEWADATTVASALHVVRCLHHAIWRRFPPGAIAYTEALRQKLFTAHLESRRRVSQDLHDRVAHGIAAGVQRLDLLRLHAASDGNAEMAKQAANIASYFRAALAEVQDMAVDLRAHVGDRTLMEAVRTYIIDTSDLPPHVTLTNEGDEFALTASQSEESLTILQEALHNARRHAANATGIVVHFAWRANYLDLQVSDNGSGFDPNHIRSGALGITVMRERARNIGSTLTIRSKPGKGTTMKIHLPKNATAIGS
jgi:signal transduction histidine kinase